MSTPTKKMMLIINPVAGKREARKKLTELIQIFSDGGYAVTVFITGKQGDATEYAARYGGNFDLIVCSGGDGTMNETVTGIVKGGLDVPVGYMPSGSYNDFAEYQQLSKDVIKAAKNIVKGSPRQVDVLSFNDKYVINAADIGAFTWLPYTTSQQTKNTLGAYAYLLEGIKDFSKIKPVHLRFYANGGVFEGNYVFGIICNATMVAGILSKKGRIIHSDDGIFEVAMVRFPENAIDFQEALQAVKTENLSSPHITFFKASKIQIESDEPVDWALDGEHMVSEGILDIENLHSRITLIC